MRELFKIDAIVKKFSKLAKNGKKIAEIAKIIGFVWTVFNIIAVIWSLIPKYEKMKEVNGETLVSAVNEAQKSEEPEVIDAEPVMA